MKKKVIVWYSGFCGIGIGSHKVRLSYCIWFTRSLYRDIRVVIDSSKVESNWFNHPKMESLMKEMMRRSGFGTEMSETDFLNLELRDFPGMTIENKLHM